MAKIVSANMSISSYADGFFWTYEMQGMLDIAFLNPHDLLNPCRCIDHLEMHTSGFVQTKESLLGTPCTTASSVLQTIKKVEGVISGRRGRSGTAAGDIAFRRGKENLAPVLRRYKRRLSKKSSATNGGASAPSTNQPAYVPLT